MVAPPVSHYCGYSHWAFKDTYARQLAAQFLPAPALLLYDYKHVGGTAGNIDPGKLLNIPGRWAAFYDIHRSRDLDGPRVCSAWTDRWRHELSHTALLKAG